MVFFIFSVTEVSACFCVKGKDSVEGGKINNVGEGRIAEAVACVGKR